MKMQTHVIGMVTALAALTATPVWSATMTWNNNGTDYNTAGNWAGGLPGSGDTASFPVAVTNQPVISATITNQRVSFGGTGWTISSADATKKLVLTGTGNSSGGAAIDENQANSPTISAPIVLGAAASSTQHVFLGNAGGPLTISGNISEANAGITLQLDGHYAYVMRFSGTNTFTGGFLAANAPILELGSSFAIPATGTFTFGRDNNLDTGNILRSTDNFLKRISAPFVLYAGPATNRLIFGSITAGQQGSIVFGGTGTLSTDTGIAVKSVNNGESCAVAFEGAIGGSGGLTVFGGHNDNTYRGYTFLLGANTYTGRTFLFDSNAVPLSVYGNLGGVCVINSIADAGTACSLGAPASGNDTIAMCLGRALSSTIYYPDGTLRYIGTGHSSSRPFQFGATLTSSDSSTAYLRLDASGTGPLTLSGNMTIADNHTNGSTRAVWITGTSTNDNTFSGVIPATTTRTSTLTKDGRGTWVLSGANTFNGALTVNSGRLILDYTNSVTVVPTNTTVTLGGGTLELRGKSSGSSAQTIGNIATANGTGLSTIRVNPNGGSGLALTTGALAVNSTAGSALLFDLFGPSGGSATIGTSLASVNGAYLIRDSVGGYYFATNAGANTEISACNATTDLPASPVNTVNYWLTGSQTVNSNTAVRSLRIDPSSAGQALTLSGNFQVAGNGVLFAGTNDFTIGGSGQLYANQYVALVLSHFGTGKLTLNANLCTTNQVDYYLAFAGTGLIDWVKRYQNNQAANYPTISGVTVRNSSTGGMLLDTNSTGAGSCNLILTGGGTLELTDQDFTRNVGTGAGAVQWRGDGGFSAYGAARAVKLNNGTASIAWPNLWSPSSFIPANNALILGSAYSDNTIDFQNGLFFGCQQRVVRVHDGVSSANVDARLSGALTGRYGGGLIKEGPGTLEIAGAGNTYEGDTWVREGTLRVNSGIGNSAVTVFGGAAISGTGTVSRLTLNSGGALKPYVSGDVVSRIEVSGTADLANGTLDLSGVVSLAGGDQTLVQCGSRNGEFAVVMGLPGGRSIQYTPTAVVLKYASGTMLLVQ